MKVRQLFTPVIKALNAMKYWQKFVLIGGILALPLFVMLAQIVGDLHTEIAGDRQRMLGAQYSEAVKRFVQDVQQHRALTVSFVNGETGLKAEYDAKREELAADIQAIESLDDSVGGALGTTDGWKALKDEWLSLQLGMAQRSAQDATDAHIAYIAKLLAFLTVISDKAGMTLDSSYEGVYLAQSTSKTLPELTEELGQGRALGMNALASGEVEDLEKARLASIAASVERSLSTLDHEMDLVFASKPELRTQLEGPYKEAHMSAAEFAELLTSVFIEESRTGLATDEYYKIATETIDSSFALYDAQTNSLKRVLEDRIAKANRQLILAIAWMAGGVLLSVYAFIGLYLSIRQVVGEITRTTRIVAEGDLTARVSFGTKDEMRSVADAFNAMTENLRGLISEVSESAEQVSASAEELNASAEQSSKASEQVAAVMQDMSGGAEKQRIGVEESAKTLEELTVGIQRMAEASTAVSASSEYTKAKAVEGGQSVELTVRQMQSIDGSVRETDGAIRRLDEKSQRIQEILGVIQEISSQTNLLALNAAIEAARAGEQGRGFAVVAGEVRKLAEQSAGSSAQIAALIGDIQNDMRRSVAAMEQVKTEVQEGMRVSDATSGIFAEIVASTNAMAERIEDMAAGAEQMSAGSQQVTSSVFHIADIAKEASAGAQEAAASTEEQLASMEEIAASASHLSNMAERLQSIVVKFKV